jgi:hypothetical protein
VVNHLTVEAQVQSQGNPVGFAVDTVALGQVPFVFFDFPFASALCVMYHQGLVQ